MTSLRNRIVVLIDMDCFFCQVECRLQPEFAGKPLAVVQYNQWKLGGIIAVNYEAREYGVTRHMRGEEAKEKCPELILASVPCLRGKADTSRYRSAGREVIDVLKRSCNIVERASVDEAYIDLTQIVDDKISNNVIEPEDLLDQLKNTFVVGFSENGINNEEQRSEGIKIWLSELSEDVETQRLLIAAAFVENLRKEIFDITGFKCSAGISFNKILAKLACGLHKPNCQTILPTSAVSDLYRTLPIKKIRNLGGKLGDIVIDSLKCNVMADLLPYSLQYLQNRFDEKTGLWLYNIARGIDTEPVISRLFSKSIGACKNFPGKQAITDIDTLKNWLGELCSEVCERLEQDEEENERRASLLTVSFHFYQNKTSVSQSRSCTLTSYNHEKITEKCVNIVIKATQRLPVSYLGVSASKFIKVKGSEDFMNFFKKNTSDIIKPSLNYNIQKVSIDSKFNESSESNSNNINIKSSEEINICHEIEKNEDNIDSRSLFNKNKDNRKSSPCSSIQKSLKTDNFQKSFFMNILKEKQSKRKLEMTVKVDEDLKNNAESSEILFNNKKDDEENMEINLISSCSPSLQSQSTSSNDIAVGLQEIFPDLNNIDPNIVQLLPLHLQQEAKKFLKITEIHNSSIEKNKLKNKGISKISKEKFSKTKSINSRLNITNFFIKTDENFLLDNKFKKCLQCEQLILMDKFEEHNDYHVAHNLQKEINQLNNRN